MHINVRTADFNDAPAIARIHIAAWRAAYADEMPADFLAGLSYSQYLASWQRTLNTQSQGCYLVCEINNTVAGFAVYGPPRDEDLAEKPVGELCALNIDPKQWGRGLGKALLEYMIKAGQKQGWSALYLWVVSSNQRAIGLYSRYGFINENKTKIDTRHSHAPLHETRFIKPLDNHF